MTISTGGSSLLRTLRRWCWLMLLLLTASVLTPAHAAAETIGKFRIAWTTYPGWMPWHYAEQHGILQKWAAKYHIAIEFFVVHRAVSLISMLLCPYAGVRRCFSEFSVFFLSIYQ